MDSDHTGHDLFLVMLVRPSEMSYFQGEGELWTYFVDAYGHVVFRGRMRHEPLSFAPEYRPEVDRPPPAIPLEPEE